MSLARALVLMLLSAAPAWAQDRIYWTVPQPGNAKEVWSMNADGSGKTNLFPAGIAPPPGYDSISSIAGPSAGAYPIDPSSPGSPSARWWLASVSGAGATAVFAFAPNGQGGVAWRQLSDIPLSPSPDVSRSITGLLALPTGASDDFASFQFLEAVHDGTAWTSTYSLVRFANPFTRPSGSVTLDQLQFLTSAGPGDAPGAQTWSPDGRFLAYIGSQPYPNGSTRRALRILDTMTGVDHFVLDTITAGVQPNRPRWSNNGEEIAFDSNSYFGSNSGVYAVNPSSGAVRAIATAGNSTDFFSAPVWSPDGTALAVMQSYQGSKASLRNRGMISRIPSSGVTKKSGPVPLTANSDAYLIPTPLGWR
ncbi:Protein TolB [Aquisphaera giovannonii]|uniref:Protein TolB n=1 Tax=Aquisphaera giovannonii TaxID=406548 RepID=A0A5B9WEB5_9BACT|nr:Protein TolB [Aquisphaera giovannonii]